MTGTGREGALRKRPSMSQCAMVQKPIPLLGDGSEGFAKKPKDDIQGTMGTQKFDHGAYYQMEAVSVGMP